jgi:hypothetical protein
MKDLGKRRTNVHVPTNIHYVPTNPWKKERKLNKGK